MTFRSIRFILSLWLGYTLVPTLGHTVACDPPGAAQTAAVSVISTLGTKMAALQVLLIKTLKLMTGQLTAHLQALPGAMAKIMSAHTQSLSQIAQEGAEARLIRDFTPSLAACHNLTLSQQRQQSDILKQEIHKRLNLKSHQQAHHLACTSGSLAKAVQYRYQHHQVHYCGAEDVTLGLCRQASTLAEGNVLVADSIINKRTLTDQDQRQAAFDATHILLKPVPTEPLRQIQVETPAGQEAYLRQKSRQARHNLAQDTFSEIIAERTPLLEAKWMTDILRAQGQTNLNLPAKISQRAFMDLEVQRRYENPQWYVDVQAMEPAEVQRQLLHMMALLLKQMDTQNKQLEKMNALQATQLVVTTEQQPSLTPTQIASTG